MSVTTETQTPANLAATRKEAAAAKKAAAAKPAPAKATTAKSAAEPKAKKDGKVYVYEASSRAGITNRRSFPTQMAVAVDVQDPNHPSPRWQKGVVTRFFTSTEMAEKYIERQTGCDCQIVPAKLVETKPVGDDK